MGNVNIQHKVMQNGRSDALSYQNIGQINYKLINYLILIKTLDRYHSRHWGQSSTRLKR